ncbi:unnamed protein product [Rotaria socialis]|uniref:Tudor domain-containing protein n=2 Tax=Rotaria socialis TaxID=392032 RepID=A0A817KXK1_9BILA|nr:unnamed protein product [Rotaria socialis]CAF3310190.1 unnamed protein product [Rotaria socialis]CAF3771880.1 unnamed protein product [Rotaria socialis]
MSHGNDGLKTEMNISRSVVKISKPSDDDLFLCRAFAKAIESDKLHQIIQQQTVSIESPAAELNTSSDDNPQMVVDSSLPERKIQWKIGDLCLCPYSEDGLFYKATIINISSTTCTISFDDYGNEEIHQLTDLKMRTEEEQEQEQEHLKQPAAASCVDENDILPSLPRPTPFPILNPNDDNDSLSSTLMSWYLAGYHTGFYQGIKDKKNFDE